ncbi:MAG: hypothetical protein AB8H80_01025 [Planctomycetota bacterium]
MRSARLLHVCVLVLACTFGAQAQEQAEAQAKEARRPMVGTVLDADNKPLPNAEVHFALASVADPTEPLVDYVVTKTDTRGRFIAKLRPCNEYRIWALGPTNEAGGRLVTDTRVAVPSELLELHAEKMQQPHVLTIAGLEPWSERAPFRIRILPGSLDVGLPPIDVGEDAKITIPVTGLTAPCFELLDRSGNWIASRTRTMTQDAQWRILPPHAVPMVVRDTQGNPIAGATVKQRAQSGYIRGAAFQDFLSCFRWRPCAALSDADGKLTVNIPRKENPFVADSYTPAVFLAEKAGYRACAAGFYSGVFMSGKLSPGAEELVFVMKKAKPLAGRLMLDENTPAAGQRLHAIFELRIEDAGGSTLFDVRRATTTDADGRFELAGLSDTERRWSLTIGSSPLLDGHIEKSKRRRTPQGPIALHALSQRRKEPVDIVLSKLHSIELTIRAKDGSPASGAAITLMSCVPSNEKAEFDENTLIARADQTGRVHVLAEPGKWFLLARTAREYHFRDITVGAPQQLSIELEDMPTTRGRVVDGDGKTLQGVTVNVRSSSQSSEGDRDPRLQAIASACNWGWLQNSGGAADGTFALTWLELPGMGYGVEFRKNGRTSETLWLDSKQQDVVVTIQ